MDSEYYRSGEYYNALCEHGRIRHDCHRCDLLEAADELGSSCDHHTDEDLRLARYALRFVAELDPKLFQPTGFVTTSATYPSRIRDTDAESSIAMGLRG